MPLDDLFKKIKVIQEFDIAKETIKIIDANSKILEDLLASQLAQGRDKNNEPVTIFGRDHYRGYTIDLKERYGVGLGKFTGWITNYMTGSFYKALFVRTKGETFTIESKVPYFNEIITRSGSKIMELNKENLEFFSESIVVPQLQKIFTQRFNGV